MAVLCWETVVPFARISQILQIMLWHTEFCMHPPWHSALSSTLDGYSNMQWEYLSELMTSEHFMMLPRISQVLLSCPCSFLPPLKRPGPVPRSCHLCLAPVPSLSGWHAAWKALLYCFQDSFLALALSTSAKRQNTDHFSPNCTKGNSISVQQYFSQRWGYECLSKGGLWNESTWSTFKTFVLGLWVPILVT